MQILKALICKRIFPQKIFVNFDDISGTGSSLIYPILGNKLYKWSFLGTGNLEFCIENYSNIIIDINGDALKNAREILEKNGFQDSIELRKSENAAIFKGVITNGERYDFENNSLNSFLRFTFTMCNPPYFSSRDEKIANPARVNLPFGCKI